MKDFGKILIIALSVVAIAVPLHATNILFTITGTLDYFSGSDTSLDGATFTFTAVFEDEPYVDFGGTGHTSDPGASATALEGYTKITITPLGASPVSGDYNALESAIFLPRLDTSSRITDSSFSDVSFNLEENGLAELSFQWNASPSALAILNNGVTTPETTHFASGQSAAFLNGLTLLSSNYTLSGGIISATATAIPEAKHVGLATGIMCLLLVGYRRRKTNS